MLAEVSTGLPLYVRWAINLALTTGMMFAFMRLGHAFRAWYKHKMAVAQPPGDCCHPVIDKSVEYIAKGKKGKLSTGDSFMSAPCKECGRRYKLSYLGKGKWKVGPDPDAAEVVDYGD